MTAPRGKVEASLAERGRPAMWANEQEAMALSGYPIDGVKFRGALPALEAEGFPRINPRNGLRFIPAIVDYWARQIDRAAPSVPESGLAAIDYEDDHAGQRKTA